MQNYGEFFVQLANFVSSSQAGVQTLELFGAVWRWLFLQVGQLSDSQKVHQDLYVPFSFCFHFYFIVSVSYTHLTLPTNREV